MLTFQKGVKRSYNMRRHLQTHTEEYKMIQEAEAQERLDRIPVKKQKCQDPIVRVRISAEFIKTLVVEFLTVDGNPFVALNQSAFKKIITRNMDGIPKEQQVTVNSANARRFVQESAEELRKSITTEVQVIFTFMYTIIFRIRPLILSLTLIFNDF